MASARPRRGVSLGELLVVIAIVTILAAILFPMFSEANLSVRSSEGTANIRRVNLAGLLYADDHNDRYVPAGVPQIDYSWSPARDSVVDRAGKPWHGWGLKLLPYVRDRRQFTSPILPKRARFTGQCAHADTMDLTSEFAQNWLLARDGSFLPNDGTGFGRSPDGTVLNRPIAIAEVRQPSNTISLLPTVALSPFASEWGCLFVTLQSGDFTNRIVFTGAYHGGDNIAFVDGHTRWFDAQKLDPNLNPDSAFYHWPSRGIWMQPTMPTNTMGYQGAG